jgi:peptide deformylase
MQTIRIYGDPVLRKTAKPVELFDTAFERFVDEMTETMIREDGVGLAANQVGEAIRVTVIDTTGGEEPPIILVNPEIVETSKEVVDAEEGCLSLPGITLPVKRPAEVSVTALDRNGNPFKIDHATGLLARALQHEIDHLNGILFIDHVSPLQRTMINGKLKKMAKSGSGDK